MQIERSNVFLIGVDGPGVGRVGWGTGLGCHRLDHFSLVGWGTVFVLLAWLVRGLTKKKRVDRLVGEVQEGLDESEFTTLVPGQNISQDRVQKQVLRQSEQAAYLIRSMLQEKKSGKSGRS